MQHNFYPFNYKGIVRVKENKAVLRCDDGHLCGYVCFPAKDVPKEWHGNYNADALQYLSIHGGITFCHVEVDGARKEELKIEYSAKIKEAKEADFMKRMEQHRLIEQEYENKIAEIEGACVVFGFDCAHAGDDQNPDLKDPQYVMKLTETMEKQLLSYANRIGEWRMASREKKIEIMSEIMKSAGEFQEELGFGALIDVIWGGANSFDK